MMTKAQYDFVNLLMNGSQQPRRLQSGEILAWLYFHQLEAFAAFIGHNYLCEGGLSVNLQSDGICVELNDLLEYMGIDPAIFKVED